MVKYIYMKEGIVLLVGRPNVGKSTFLNNLVGQKVSITSPKPQTTRFPIRVLSKHAEGRLLFVDTPGIFGKAQDYLSKKINRETMEAVKKSVDIVLYMVDQSRARDFEESKVLGIVREVNCPNTFLVINKIDIQEPSFLAQYLFLQDEVKKTFSISALSHKHFKPLIDYIFEILPEREEEGSHVMEDSPFPLQNMDSHTYMAEVIREKVFLYTGQEVPYTTTVVVDVIEERQFNLTYIKARLLTTEDRYKRMLIGKNGSKIKELGRLARKEIELIINRKVYLQLDVEVDSHWQSVLYE